MTALDRLQVERITLRRSVSAASYHSVDPIGSSRTSVEMTPKPATHFTSAVLELAAEVSDVRSFARSGERPPADLGPHHFASAVELGSPRGGQGADDQKAATAESILAGRRRRRHAAVLVTHLDA